MARNIILATILSVTLSLSLPSSAQENPDGNRMIIHHDDGRTEVLVVDQIESMQIITIPDTYTAIALDDIDESSVTAQFTMSEGCTRFIAACTLTSNEEWQQNPEDYLLENYTFQATADEAFRFIDLDPSLEYTILTLAFDQFGFPCEVKSATFTTSEAIPSGPVEIGYYLYRDGTWSSQLKDTKTPVAIVFSTDPVSADRERGYTHGYAVALNDIPEMEWTLEADQDESGDSFTSTDDADINDRDGLSHTLKLLENPTIHPAAAAARDYAPTPTGTSGWFLPAAGQLIDMLCGLGELDRADLTRSQSGTAEWPKEIATEGIGRLNACLSTAGEGNYSPLAIYNWSSTERSVMAAFYLYANPLLNISLQSYNKDAKFAVRPIIAF